MLTVETLADISEDGTLTARTPAYRVHGKRRVVIVIDDARQDTDDVKARRLPDLSEFRARLQCKPYPGNSVVDFRNEER